MIITDARHLKVCQYINGYNNDSYCRYLFMIWFVAVFQLQVRMKMKIVWC